MAKGIKTGGRQKGSINKVNAEFRDTVRMLLDENSQNIAIWLKTVADGDPANDVKPNPAKALDIIAGLAEYAAPKLARTEMTVEITDNLADRLQKARDKAREAE
jgi:hypothetical protein